MKTCTACGEVKPLDEYHRQKAGRRAQCKQCRNRRSAKWRASNPEYMSEWYAANPGYMAGYMDGYYAANPHIMWEGNYRGKAKRYGFEPVVESFTRDELITRWGSSCWHCKTGPFEELDHFPVPIVRGGHHTLEGTRPSCRDCNRASWREAQPA